MNVSFGYELFIEYYSSKELGQLLGLECEKADRSTKWKISGSQNFNKTPICKFLSCTDDYNLLMQNQSNGFANAEKGFGRRVLAQYWRNRKPYTLQELKKILTPAWILLWKVRIMYHFKVVYFLFLPGK